MNRFEKTKKDKSIFRELAMPVALFAVIAVVFSNGLSSISSTAEEERLKSTKQAVARAAVHCYALEGIYPPTIEYLEEHYGLTVDSDKYAVDYQCFASNIMPDITVIKKTTNDY